MSCTHNETRHEIKEYWGPHMVCFTKSPGIKSTVLWKELGWPDSMDYHQCLWGCFFVCFLHAFQRSDTQSGLLRVTCKAKDLNSEEAEAFARCPATAWNGHARLGHHHRRYYIEQHAKGNAQKHAHVLIMPWSETSREGVRGSENIRYINTCIGKGSVFMQSKHLPGASS